MFDRDYFHLMPQLDGACYEFHRLNDPFDYRPDDLAMRGYEAVMAYVSANEELKSSLLEGKMLGVLVARSECGAMGYLMAHSGELMGQSRVKGFVPPIYDLDSEYFRGEEERISQLNEQLKMLDGGDKSLVAQLKMERKELSQQLQRRLFESYKVVNGRGEWSSVYDIFEQRYHRLPPAATGECAAPKLLQYALTHKLQPLSMGEFWVGQSPRSELRREGEFYGACRGRCYPLLSYMLQGVEVAAVVEGLRRDKLFREDDLNTLYEDADLLIFDKPAGMLSVRGVDPNVVSVEDVVKSRYGCDGAFMVHRLDQATSGVLVVARNRAVYVAMQGQFARRELTKRYVALVAGTLEIGREGVISLPLIADIYDRPRQRVADDIGKPSYSGYRILANERYEGREVSRVELTPHTGRTHQLRVHAAHPQGLNAPIVGDLLYGSVEQCCSRMCLHAESISFIHPVSGCLVELQSEAAF